MIRRRTGFAMMALGWLMIMLVLIMGCIRTVGSDHELYYSLQMAADVLPEAGISEDDLRLLDLHLATYLFAPANTDTGVNMQLEVFGERQWAFNERERIHLKDCRMLLAPTVSPLLNGLLAAAGAALVLFGRRMRGGGRLTASLWTASAIILIPLGLFGLWAFADFDSAFTFFHELLFTNDLWLLNWDIDLLIRICPASMFANMGLRIGMGCAAVVLGLPVLYSILSCIFERRKRKYL